MPVNIEQNDFFMPEWKCASANFSGSQNTDKNAGFPKANS
jgi:hypothetical protein